MHILFESFVLVALAEMGDKTQLLALVLASRFKKPWTIMGGILVATVLNHLLAASIGTYLSTLIPAPVLKYILAAIFVGFAAWILIPDKEDEETRVSRFGPFVTTVITFFLAEMGDKTQFATLALAAKFQNLPLVTLGTTLGMLFTDGLAVFFGDRLTRRIPVKWIHGVACLIYVAFAIGLVVQSQ
jgi:putative Ca2+/H+ antiporter (TMEM165/GDT1 family)